MLAAVEMGFFIGVLENAHGAVGTPNILTPLIILHALMSKSAGLGPNSTQENILDLS